MVNGPSGTGSQDCVNHFFFQQGFVSTVGNGESIAFLRDGMKFYSLKF